jgi:hypothetical protein
MRVYRAEFIVSSFAAFLRRRYVFETLRMCCYAEFPEARFLGSLTALGISTIWRRTLKVIAR